MNAPTEIPKTENPFVGQLFSIAARHDRGKLADLRRGLSPGTEQSAWPVLGALGAFRDRREMLPVYQTVGALFALHPTVASIGNFGVTCRRVAKDREEAFDRRFRRLIACDTLEDLCGRLVGVVKMAKSNGVLVDYDRLFTDLRWFERNPQRLKIDWARQYWGAGDAKEESAPGKTEGGE